ncbi:MAG: oxygen-independent coproporphyrinogen III oxidase-like protein, partial [Sedimenticolaceae bacterium]
MDAAAIPLSLYVHIPWCVQKCPYCDFNSHQAKSELDEERYVQQLLN